VYIIMIIYVAEKCFKPRRKSYIGFCRVSTVYPKGLCRTPTIYCVYTVADTHIIIIRNLQWYYLGVYVAYAVLHVMRFTAPNRIIYYYINYRLLDEVMKKYFESKTKFKLLIYVLNYAERICLTMFFYNLKYW